MSTGVSACVTRQRPGFRTRYESVALIPQVFHLSCFLSDQALPKRGLFTFRLRGRQPACCRYVDGLQGFAKCSRRSATKSL